MRCFACGAKTSTYLHGPSFAPPVRALAWLVGAAKATRLPCHLTIRVEP